MQRIRANRHTLDALWKKTSAKYKWRQMCGHIGAGEVHMGTP
jgi:hypothetical protein